MKPDGWLLRRNVKRFWGGLVFRAHGLVYHSALGSMVRKKKKKVEERPKMTDLYTNLECQVENYP